MAVMPKDTHQTKITSCVGDKRAPIFKNDNLWNLGSSLHAGEISWLLIRDSEQKR